MSEAIDTIRNDFDKPLRFEDVAKKFHMSMFGFHTHFKSVTAMSSFSSKNRYGSKRQEG
jgi:AraC-like DNA-binding protein